MCDPLLGDFQKVLNEAQTILMPNEEQKTILGKKPRILKDYLIRAKITNRGNKEYKSALCNGKRYHVCTYIEERGEFECSEGSKCDIRKRVVNCNTDFSVYKLHCGSCSKQYDM